MGIRPRARLTGLFLCCAFLSSTLPAQQPTGVIRGVVTDATGGVVSGASVSIVHKANQFTRREKTSDAGTYSVSALLPGEYEVCVEAPGFRRKIIELKVEVGRVATVDVRLDVGGLTQTVKVEANGQ